MFGGEISFRSSIEKDGDEFENVFILNPTYSVFLSKNIAVGGSVFYRFSKEGDLESNTYGIGPAIRFYLNPIKRFKIFFGAQYYYRKTSDNRTRLSLYSSDDYYYASLEGGDYFYSNWSLSLLIGSNIFLAKNVALEPYINIRRLQESSSYEYQYPWKFEVTEGIRIAVFIF